MSADSSCFAAFNIIFSSLVKKLQQKAEKQNKIKTLADTKLSALYSQISKVLDEYFVSDSELSTISDELVTYSETKEKIRQTYLSHTEKQNK